MAAPHAAAQTEVNPRLDDMRALTATITRSDTTVTAGGRVRNRPSSAMADFYPVDGSGFHISGGFRFFEGRSMARRNLSALRELVYIPRSTGNSGVHWGYRRTLSAAAGYTQPLGDDVSLGLEIGMLSGRALNRGGRRMGVRSDGHGDGNGRNQGPNAIVHVVVNATF